MATQPLKSGANWSPDAAVPGLSGKGREKKKDWENSPLSLIVSGLGLFHLLAPTWMVADTGTGLLDLVLASMSEIA